MTEERYTRRELLRRGVCRAADLVKWGIVAGLVGTGGAEVGVAIDAKAVKKQWCEKVYVEVYDSSGKLLGRLDKRGNILDISFTEDEEGFCSYCFDGIKNYDETGVDCGGPNCPMCVDYSPYVGGVNWWPWLFWLLFTMMLGLLIFYLRKWVHIEKKQKIFYEMIKSKQIPYVREESVV